MLIGIQIIVMLPLEYGFFFFLGNIYLYFYFLIEFVFT